jgi:hypothetical protein
MILYIGMRKIIYKAAMLPIELHDEVKSRAAKKSLSIIQYISYLVAKEGVTNGKR